MSKKRSNTYQIKVGKEKIITHDNEIAIKSTNRYGLPFLALQCTDKPALVVLDKNNRTQILDFKDSRSLKEFKELSPEARAKFIDNLDE